MAYKSTHTGEQIDNAVRKVLDNDFTVGFNKIEGEVASQLDLQEILDSKAIKAGVINKGNASTPVYFNERGEALAVTEYHGTAARADLDGAGNRISTYYAKLADTTNKAKSDLSNIEVAEQRKVFTGFKALKNVNEVLTDELGYTSIKEMKDSAEIQGTDRILTEDVRKEGTPVISGEGMLIGATSSNYVKIPVSIQSGFRLEGKFSVINLKAETTVTDGAIELFINGIGAIRARINVGGSWVAINGVISYSSDSNASHDFEFYIENNSNTWKFGVKQGSGAWYSVSQAITAGAFLTTVDLKASNIEYDLNCFKEVINGVKTYQPMLRIPYIMSKTGNKVVDSKFRNKVNDAAGQVGYANYLTVGEEAEKYYVDTVGNPTLVGGVASGFSNGYKIQTVNFNPSNKTWEITFSFNNNIYVASGQQVILSQFQNNIVVYMDAVSGLTIRVQAGQWDDQNVLWYSKKIDLNINYKIIVGYNLSGYYVKLFNQDINTLVDSYSNSNTTVIYDGGDNKITLGNHNTNNNLPFTNGSIDLKQLSITVDGVEVFRGYEPAIPNTYTLPQGETLRPVNTVVASTNNYTFDTNMNLVQRGTCTANQAVTFPKAFVDANYFLSCPYSSKSRTGFTPTQTGDYIAKGKGTVDNINK